tara:strand:- start:2268 stop:2894 length:627 start_codon:yes stop_codon:yes gene_type:complete
MDINVDDSVQVTGGKWKGYTAQMITIRPTYCQMRLIKDKKGKDVEGNVSAKVKKCYLNKVEQAPIEMPTDEQLVNIDVTDNVSQTLFDSIDKKIMENKDDSLKIHKVPAVTDSLETHKVPAVTKMKVDFVINENNVKSPALTMDDCENLKKENFTLNTQLQSMMSFQGDACKEIADLKWIIKDLQEQLDDSVRLEHLEEIRTILNNIL